MFKTFLTKRPFLFKFRLFLGLILLVFILVFLYLKIVPFGQITYERVWPNVTRSGKGFILGFTPAERVDLNGTYPKLSGDPVYFSLFTPRTFDHVKMTITYRDNLSTATPVIEAGVLKDKIARNYDLSPVSNKILDYLGARWTKIRNGQTVFLQVTKNYDTLSDFLSAFKDNKLKDCPNGSATCVAVYNYPLNFDYPAPVARDTALILDKPLRGGHQFYVYVPVATLDLSFSFVDMNRDKEQDPIAVNLYQDNKLVDSKFLGDNNLNPTSGITEQKNISLGENNLKPGVYKVEVKISDDVVISRIESSVNKLSFINKIWPVSTPGNLTLYTDASYLLTKAFTPASLQTINFAGQDFKLDEPYSQFKFVADTANPLKAVKFKKDDIILENNGVFAWSPESLFNPTLPKVDSQFVVSSQIKYIVADYQAPLAEKDWQAATLDFDLKDSYRENGKYSFMISIPGLRTETGQGNLEIKEIKMELSGRGLLDKIRELIKSR